MCLNRRERGNAFIEFVLVASFFFVPIVLGLVTVGISVIRSQQVTQLTRDVGHMLAKGVDFSQQGNQNMVVNDLANGLSLQANAGNVTGSSTGNGVLVLSTFENLTATCDCPNAGHTVVVDRIVIGNNTLYQSGFGNPAYIDPTSGQVANYSSDAGAIADNLSSVISLPAGGLAFMCEGDFAFNDLGVAGYMTKLGAFNRAVF
ncbi:MAG: hypothetical protein ABSH32_06400 [Bryobacteraceae bacterium]|jgi:hypothetical protein